MSKQWENDKAKNIDRQTDTSLKAYTCGYSGNNAMNQPDILLCTPTENYALELKGPIQSDTCYIEAEDVTQLKACGNSYTTIGLVIKFPRREPLVVRYFDELTNAQHGDVAGTYNEFTDAEKFATLIDAAFNPRVTKSGTLAVDNPSTEDWPSAMKGSSDEDAILSGLGIVTGQSLTVE